MEALGFFSVYEGFGFALGFEKSQSEDSLEVLRRTLLGCSL